MANVSARNRHGCLGDKVKFRGRCTNPETAVRKAMAKTLAAQKMRRKTRMRAFKKTVTVRNRTARNVARTEARKEACSAKGKTMKVITDKRNRTYSRCVNKPGPKKKPAKVSEMSEARKKAARMAALMR